MEDTRPLDEEMLASLSDVVDETGLSEKTPSPREIQRLKNELQAGWSEQERHSHLVVKEEPMETFVMVSYMKVARRRGSRIEGQ